MPTRTAARKCIGFHLPAIALGMLLASASASAVADAPAVNDPGFAKMLADLLPKSVTKVSVDEASKVSGAQFLDAREPSEFAVSRLPGARNVGFKRFDLESVADLDRNQPVIVYCSVGYRSALITQQLADAGFSDVRNLYGGIFEWVNEGQPVVNSQGDPTEKVHAFSPRWGVWLTRGEKVFD